MTDIPPVRILESDTITETATKIYEQFAIGQSCTIKGLADENGKIISRGEKVLELITQMDINENVRYSKADKRPRRKRVVLPNTIGGFVAQKIFKYESRTVDGEYRITIWRLQ